MKKFLTIAAVTATLVGCSTFIGDNIATVARLAGTATGQAVNMGKFNAKTHNTIIEVVNVLRDVTPGVEQSFVECWSAAADKYLDEIVAKGKFDASLKPLVLTGVKTVGMGIDYLFEKHPEWEKNENQVKEAITAFCDGFLSICTPVDEASESVSAMSTKCGKVELDVDTLNYLKRNGRF